LNLLRGGADPATNYYGLVRPELEFRRDVQGLQNQLTQGLTSVNQAIDQASGLPLTGHGVSFLNTGHYFAGSAALRGGTGRSPGLGSSTFGGLGSSTFGTQNTARLQAPAARR
jgi:hypothetical protein